ncbi:UNVERIFIED_CONTAM: Heparanase-like protein 2 [Sesamum latifolium]|uniref:Heparanase-like protein 2 n=1 Tax=Sesamum latifolium TaxID=2727402 RepID=A0AAW2UU49_9LAMI
MWDVYTILVDWSIGVEPTELTHENHHMKILKAWSSECAARTVGSKKTIHLLSVCDRGISYALGDTFMLLKAVATMVAQARNSSLRRCTEACVVSILKHNSLVKDGNRHSISHPRLGAMDLDYVIIFYIECPVENPRDLKNKILANAIRAFNPLRLRIGGSLQDQVVYDVGRPGKKCQPFKLKDDGLFGFSKVCLPMERWDQLNKLFNETGAKITFGLNALSGRKKSHGDPTLMIGKWHHGNARDFMNYTAHKGYKIDSYELGNELCGSGVSARILPEQYGKDVITLKTVLRKLYPDPSSRPKILGPGGFYDEQWFNTFLEVSGPDVVDGLTHHIYNLGAGVDPNLIKKIQDPFFLDEIAQTHKDVSTTVKLFGPWSGAWVGEAGGAYNSGGKDVSHAFVNGFWYLDQLGMTSTFNHKVFCRQALIGGNYALLNTTSFIPNPDYYGALLWHRLMGQQVLSTSHDGSPYLRAYSHCSKKTSGISVLLINMSNSTTFEVSVMDDLNLYPEEYSLTSGGYSTYVWQREEYHLTPKDGNIQSDVVLLNGTPLKLTESSDIPAMDPQVVDAASPITVRPIP